MVDPRNATGGGDERSELDELDSVSIEEAIAPLGNAARQSDNLDIPSHPPGAQGGVVDRRLGLDRRSTSPSGSKPTGLERRRGRGRRLSDSQRAAEEGELTREQFLFLMAIDAFKQGNHVAYPSWSDVLEVVRLLGYRKVQPSAVDLGRAEDWTEPPEAPANVQTHRQRLRNAQAKASYRAGEGGKDKAA